jgi:hypothetical protein
MNSRYARFECRICGELIYSPIVLEPESNTSFQENKLPEPTKTDRSIELTCAGGHSDVYYVYEIMPPEAKPPSKVYLRRAMAAGG